MSFYSFFVIQRIPDDTDFMIFSTTMRVWTLRLSAMRSCFKRYANSDYDSNVAYKDYYRFFMADYNAVCIHRGIYTKEEAEEKVKELTEQRRIWKQKA